MQGRTIDLTPYVAELAGRAPDAEPVLFDIRKSLCALLFVEKAGPRELLKRAALADAIDGHTDDTFLFTEDQWAWLCNGLEAAQLHGRHEVEFIRRVLDAPLVEVGPKAVN